MSARARNIIHTFLTEGTRLGVRSALVIAVLVTRLVSVLGGADDIILQLAHGLKVHARGDPERLHRLTERVLRRRLQGLPVLVEERTEHAERRHLRERIEKGCGIAGQDIEVAARCLNEGEEAGAVDTLTAGEDRVEIIEIGEHEVECLHFPVAARVQEVDPSDAVLTDKSDDVVTGDRLWCRL